MNKTGYMALWMLTLVIAVGVGYLLVEKIREPGSIKISGKIPDLVGTWSGENFTVSHTKGYREWGPKVVHITEQKDRRFKGTFTYVDGTKNFFGVIYPDNTSFTWVAPNAKGFNHGRILGKNTISACYVESWVDATAGCAELIRQED